MEKKVVRSTCRMCHGVCQVLVHLEGSRVVKITGNPESPASRGYLCPKGAASPELLYHPDRILHPMRRAGKRGENKWEKISWDEALDEMAGRLRSIKKESGPEYFAMLQGTSRPYTGFAQRFLNAFGSPNFTGVAHLCYVPRFLASMITFGPMPMCDFYGFGGETPKCVVIWGSNVVHTGSSDGICGGVVATAVQKAEKVIVVDPRHIAPVKHATHWLQLRPGTDGALALAMIHVIIAEDLVDHEFVDNYTLGFDRLRDHVKASTPEWAEKITGLPAEDIRSAARTYATTRPACILWGNAVDMSRCNFQTARSLLILRAITGNIDRPGGDLIPVHPEGVRMKSPYADHHFSGDSFLPLHKMGRVLDGRSARRGRFPSAGDIILSVLNTLKRPVAPLLDRIIARQPFTRQLALITGLKKPRFPLCPLVHPPAFWKSVITGDPYRLRGLWIMGSNPLTTMTDPEQVDRALELIEYVVVSDFFMTPTAQRADLVLPASTWLERDDVLNIHKQWCVLAQRRVASVGDTRDDRDVMIDLARRLGLRKAFPWKDYPAFLDWMLQGTGISFDEFCERGILTGPMRYFKYRDSGFATESGKFEIYSRALEKMGVSPLPVYREPACTPVSAPELAREYPLILIGGVKGRYFFHSEFRQIPSLRKRQPEPQVEINPATAAGLGLREGDRVWIETPRGRVTMKAKLFDGIAPGVVSAPHAWWFPEEGPPDYGFTTSNINMLFGEMEYDPDTGSEPLKSMLCRVFKNEE